MGSTPEHPESRLRLAACALLVAHSACSHELDDLYCDPHCPSAGDAGSVAASDEPRALPALPDEQARDACEACARGECAAERAACLEDDSCTALLACKGECDDPACLEECGVERGRSIWYEDYFACVYDGSRCPEACRVGENWECRGQYATRSEQDGPYTVTWHFVNEYSAPSITGATVFACPYADCPLGSRVGAGMVGAYGVASFELRSAPFDGYLQLTGGPLDERALIFSAPVTGPQTIELSYAGRELLVGVAGVTSLGLDVVAPGYAAFVVRQLDCLRVPAPVAFTLEGEPFEEIAVEGPGVVVARLRRADDAAEELLLEGRLAATDELVSQRAVVVSERFVTQVSLLPLERD